MLDKIFHLVCHQIPARSPRLQESVFPACYRCAGLYGGVLCSYLSLWLGGGLRRRFPARNTALAVTLPVMVFLADAWGNGLGLWNSVGWFRALTGLGAGIAMPILLLPLTGDFAQSNPSLRHPAALAAPALAGAGFVWLLDHPGGATIFQGLAIACAAGLGALAMNIALAFQVYVDERFRNSAHRGMLRAGSGD